MIPSLGAIIFLLLSHQIIGLDFEAEAKTAPALNVLSYLHENLVASPLAEVVQASNGDCPVSLENNKNVIERRGVCYWERYVFGEVTYP